MVKFQTIKGIAADLMIDNIDTDMLIPKQFLKTITRHGLGKNLFSEMRYNQDGTAKSEFILNKAPFDKAEILLSGDNFGCGSSREHAPWALLDFGIRCIIAKSFADIFYNNCFENGILPIILDVEIIEKIVDFTRHGHLLEVNLELEEISCEESTFKFQIDAFRKHCLLNGLDTIGLTMEKKSQILEFETKQKNNQPWLWNN